MSLADVGGGRGLATRGWASTFRIVEQQTFGAIGEDSAALPWCAGCLAKRVRPVSSCRRCAATVEERR